MKFFNKKQSFPKNKKDFNPNHDWSLLLVLTMVIGVLWLGINITIFFKAYRGEIFTYPISTEVKVQAVNRRELDTVIADFRNKEARFNKYKDNFELMSDPSI